MSFLRPIIALCLMLPFFGTAQQVIIKGRVDSSYLTVTTRIYATAYDDYISYREKELAVSDLGPKGEFQLSFSTSRTVQLFLHVDNARAEMVAEPGKEYRVNFFPKDPEAPNTLGSSVPVELEFFQSDNNDLNYLISDFTVRYETLMDDYRANIARKEPAIFKKIDTLEQMFKKKYAAYGKPYLDNYVYYTFATLEEDITLDDKEKVYRKHLAAKPVQLTDHSYMTFFNRYFAVTASFFMSSTKMAFEINSKQNFASLLDYFSQSKQLSNDTIREAVILKALSEHSRYPEYKLNAVLEVLGQAAEQCKVADNRKIAANLKRKLSVMAFGKPAPTMTFRDLDGKEVSLRDFKGKYVYLNFWASWCSSCTQDMTLIPELKKQFGGKIVFVSVSVDKKPEAAKSYLKKNPQISNPKISGPWTQLYCDNYRQVKEEFNVLTVPVYYIIDPKGNVYRSPAARPADVGVDMYEIKKKK